MKSMPHLEPFLAQPSQDTVEAARAIFDQCLRLMAEKEQNYGGAWRTQGWQGNIARILSKCARLKAMLWREQPQESSTEPVEDTLLDLINLSVFTLINRRNENRWGN